MREMAERAGAMTHNTMQTNLTGHPALTLPGGIGENELPIGIQLIGKHWGESLLFRVAHAKKQALNIRF